MGITKTEGYSTEQVELAELLKAIAHPARIAILQQIIATQQCICNDLVQELPLSQASVSQHLKALKQAEIIKGSISGSSICYCINEPVWRKLNQACEGLFNSYLNSENCC